MTHDVLDGISPQQIFEKCLDLKDAGIFAEGPLNFENSHYWNMGRAVFYKLCQLDNSVMNERNRTLLDIEVRINYNEPYSLSIKQKPKPQFIVDIDCCYPRTDFSGLIKVANNLKKGFESMFTSLRNISITKVIFNEPATIVIWSDNTKTVVKVQEGEIFDKEKGLAMAICKKALGNEGNYYSEFKKWLED